MKVALFALLTLLGTRAAPTARDEDEDDEGGVSLDLNYNAPSIVDDEPAPIHRHKHANVPQDVPLADWARELLYSAEIQVGTPPQTVTVHLDTGSSDLSVWNGDNCTMQECTKPSNQPQFHPSNSSTYKVVKASAKPYLKYGSGFSAGEWAEDRVSMGGFTQEHQRFLSQSDGDTGYGGLNVTGLLGMGFPALAVGGDIKTYWVANAIGRFKKPMFSFYLQHTNALANGKIPHTTPGGVLTLGGVNKKFYKGEITYTDVQTPLKYWTIPLEEVKFNGQVASNGTADAIIDTGTSLIYGPIDVISPFIKSIPGARLHDSSYVVPCNTTATFSLKFSGREFTVPSKDFLYLATTADPTLCYTAIVGHSGWLVGDSFLKNVYSVFQWEPARVGFAELRD